MDPNRLTCRLATVAPENIRSLIRSSTLHAGYCALLAAIPDDAARDIVDHPSSLAAEQGALPAL
jgi:hypothetical protein